MLASFFKKSRPINYAIIGAALLLFYVLYLIREGEWLQNPIMMARKAGLLVLLAASLFLTGFVTVKNTLTKNNTYALLLFMLFLVLFPTTMSNDNIIIANFFLLLALRRLISLQSLITPKEKIFDASFWIFAASIFHFWSLSYIVLVFISIIFHVASDYRNWIIPIIAFCTVGILYFMAGLILGHGFFEHVQEQLSISFDFTYFENVYQNIALAIFASIALLFTVPYIPSISSKPLNLQSSHKKILASFLLGAGIYALSNNKNNSYLAFTFAPLAIMGANYIQAHPNKWVREAIVMGIAVVAIAIFVLQL
ncbi:hypothetical protein AM493_14380 [Flavobacterium akiainvivens]|uniref:Beta-carotene 15,15'-monooxygenase n=1 Tax=Flavobacterium akiainvivens TaxID=1202724 RepID=A0A0M9VIX0_9FLAO|nr:DUF6427 family protein [Flavobacterium akiainvivens]KOS07089.1 hypothetical protein AM493_14380 [Flavobacterium akiainvivens]SFQ75547.1 hypothetical protein SAMN05444144_1226 [Flavobacterium akiainvivens]